MSLMTCQCPRPLLASQLGENDEKAVKSAKLSDRIICRLKLHRKGRNKQITHWDTIYRMNELYGQKVENLSSNLKDSKEMATIVLPYDQELYIPLAEPDDKEPELVTSNETVNL